MFLVFSLLGFDVFGDALRIHKVEFLSVIRVRAGGLTTTARHVELTCMTVRRDREGGSEGVRRVFEEGSRGSSKWF